MDCKGCGQECRLRRKRNWRANRSQALQNAKPEPKTAMHENSAVKSHRLTDNSRLQRRRTSPRVFRRLQISTSREIGVWSGEPRRLLGSPQILRKIEL